MCATQDNSFLDTVSVDPSRHGCLQAWIAGILVHDSLILPCPSIVTSSNSLFRSTGSLEGRGRDACVISNSVILHFTGATKEVKAGAPAYLCTLHEAQQSLREVILLILVNRARHTKSVKDV